MIQPPTDIVAGLLDDTDRCLSDLVRYVEGYTGSYFATTGRRPEETWADPSPDRLTMEDIQSTALLSVTLRPVTMIALLEQNERLTTLLAEIPTVVDLAAAPDAVEPWTGLWIEAAQAHAILRQVDGVGRTVASKLLARKRPALLPLWDTRVSGILGTSGRRGQRLVVDAVGAPGAQACAHLATEGAEGEASPRRPGDGAERASSTRHRAVDVGRVSAAQLTCTIS